MQLSFRVEDKHLHFPIGCLGRSYHGKSMRPGRKLIVDAGVAALLDDSAVQFEQQTGTKQQLGGHVGIGGE